jgi:predicted phage terminase large subunit-like protein
MTRWHRDDLAGRLLREEPDEWRVLSFPGLRRAEKTHPDDPREEGEALWPWRKSRKVLEREQKTSPGAFMALYQQDPGEAGGTEWPSSYFGPWIWCEKWPDVEDFKMRIVAVDPSKGKEAKHGDYSAIVFVGVHKNGRIYVDCWMDRRPPNVIVTKTLDFCIRYRPHFVGIEANQFQELLVTEFNKQTKHQWGNQGWRAFGMTNTLKKELRIRRLGPYIVDHDLRFKTDAPGCRLLVDQLMDFPNAEHDDGPDALEMALRLPQEVGELSHAG